MHVSLKFKDDNDNFKFHRNYICHLDIIMYTKYVSVIMTLLMCYLRIIIHTYWCFFADSIKNGEY